MLGVVVSAALVQLVVFWEPTSVFSFPAHRLLDAPEGRAARRTHGLHRHGQRRAGTAGGRARVSHIVVAATNSTRVLRSGDLVRAPTRSILALGLVLLGALTKSAQFFHFWLPHAMAAPTPVSAYLHSATMVKAGVFLLARLWPVLGHRGMVLDRRRRRPAPRCCWAATWRCSRTTWKGLLAYSTISHLGLITLLLGLNSPLAAVAAVFHMMNHATFKGVALHGRGHHRPRERRATCAGSTACSASCRSPAAGHRGLRGDGRGAAAQRLPLEGDVLRRDRLRQRTPGHRTTACPQQLRWRACSRWSTLLRFGHDVFFGPPPTDCPRQPHEPVHWMRSRGTAGAGLRGRRHTAGMDHRTCARAGRAASGRRHAASVQPWRSGTASTRRW